jgi:hypothetical protein
LYKNILCRKKQSVKDKSTRAEPSREAYARLRAQRVLALESDGESIRMAPPFSGVPTQHVVVDFTVIDHLSIGVDRRDDA